MHGQIMIPEQEYKQRAEKAAEILRRENLDALIVNGNEADYANTRYFSGFWPLFEVGGVAIAPSGKSALMVGPESEEFAHGWSPIDNIHRMVEY